MAEKIIIEGKHATLSNDNSTSESHKIILEQLAEGFAEATLSGLHPEPVPDNIQWIVRLHQLTVCVVQLLPERRWIKWLAQIARPHLDRKPGTSSTRWPHPMLC